VRAPRILLALVAATLAAIIPAVADDYVDMLKEKCPGWERYTNGNFAPMYEPLARQMVEDYGLTDGVAVEIGGNCSPFSMHLARMTSMTVYELDIDPWAMRLLGVFVDEAGLTRRGIPVEGDVQALPLKDDFANLVFSRGSIPFWPDQQLGIAECYRILKPGGVAYIGHGGFGRLLDPEVRDELVKWRLQWDTGDRKRPEGWNGPKERMLEMARAVGAENSRLVLEPDVGWWLEMRK
jgi:SAM-dependent methyltransferase